MPKIASLILNTEGKIKHSWWVVIFFLILFALLFPLILLADQYHFEITLWHQVILIVLVSVSCQAFRQLPQNELFGKIDGKWFKELVVGFLVGSALMILPAIVLTMLGSIQWQVNTFSFSILASGILVMVAVVLAEEMLFRGFIFQRLIGAVGQWPAQLIIAGLFLLTHLNNPGMTGSLKIIASVNIFIASILFGIARIKTNNLALPLGLHFMANVMQGTVLGFGVSGDNEPGILQPVLTDAPEWLTGGSFGLEASAPGLVSLILITFLLTRWKLE